MTSRQRIEMACLFLAGLVIFVVCVSAGNGAFTR